METEYTIYLLKFVFFTIGLGVISLICVFTYQHYRDKRKERDLKFEVMYDNFKSMLYDPLRPINIVSWKELNKYFDQIEAMNYKHEKTDVLRGELLTRYQPIIEEIENELDDLMSGLHEFDPSQYFGDEHLKNDIAKKAHTVYEKMKPVVEPVMK